MFSTALQRLLLSRRAPPEKMRQSAARPLWHKRAIPQVEQTLNHQLHKPSLLREFPVFRVQGDDPQRAQRVLGLTTGKILKKSVP